MSSHGLQENDGGGDSELICCIIAAAAAGSERDGCRRQLPTERSDNNTITAESATQSK